ncbi:DUF1638 domain-containing protein [Thermoanaerobacterium sp. DL9XJH110]|uniref:DUF1638 domain-containing protein n=1 Tax=Thermoanaerobacterium sp. DL9XJH110 TaxID=3386643 RepID=UPI003BB593A1
MKNIIIACQTLMDELNLAINETCRKYPVIWVDSDYHSDPNRLKLKLQQEIDGLADIDNILLAYGFCGNAVIGLTASTANLIFPKTDDCISMVLSKPGEEFQRMKATYFLTKGWIESPKSLMMEYSNALKRYGENRAKRIFRVMLKHYNQLMIIDTGAYRVADYIEKARKIAEITDLDLIVEKGGIWLLKKLLTGPYDDDFCFVKKGQEVDISHLGYHYSEQTHQKSNFF